MKCLILDYSPEDPVVQCDDKSMNITMSEYCDGVVQCSDGSDELENCHKYCEDYMCVGGKCMRTPHGPKCLCDFETITFKGDIDIQVCEVLPNNRTCFPLFNYESRLCLSTVVYNYFMYFFTGSAIVKYDVKTDRKSIVKDNMENVTEIISEGSYIFWKGTSGYGKIDMKTSLVDDNS